MKDSKVLPHLAALTAMLIWGGSYVWSSQVFQTLGPSTTVFMRLIISSIFLWCIIMITRRQEKIQRQHVGLFFLASFLEPFLYFIGESYGLTRVSPTICSAIIATIPLFAPFAAFFIIKERIGICNIIGLIISFLGVIIMLINKDLELAASPIGLAFLFSAVIVAVFYGITLKKLTMNYNPVTIVTMQNSIGIIYFLPFMLLTERHELSNVLLVENYIIPLLLLGILASSIAYVLYTYCVEKLGVSRSNVYANVIPIFTLIFSHILIKEEITIYKVIGVITVIAGLILSQLNLKKKHYDYK